MWAWSYLQNVPATFTHIKSSGPGHFWSLAVEEHFYLIWPLLVYFMSISDLKKFLFIVLAASPLLRLIFIYQGIGVFYLTPFRMDALG